MKRLRVTGGLGIEAPFETGQPSREQFMLKTPAFGTRVFAFLPSMYSSNAPQLFLIATNSQGGEHFMVRMVGVRAFRNRGNRLLLLRSCLGLLVKFADAKCRHEKYTGLSGKS